MPHITHPLKLQNKKVPSKVVFEKASSFHGLSIVLHYRRFKCLYDVMLLQEAEAWTIFSHLGGSAGRTVLAA
jgi:hypothetical protein